MIREKDVYPVFDTKGDVKGYVHETLIGADYYEAKHVTEVDYVEKGPMAFAQAVHDLRGCNDVVVLTYDDKYYVTFGK